MAQGFGSTLGVGASDVLLTKARAYATNHTISVWYNRNGAGGSSFGGLSNSSHALFFWHSSNGSLGLRIVTTGTPSDWYLTGGTSATTGVWNHFSLVLDTGAAVNATPVAYCNGVALTVTPSIGGGSGTGTRVAPGTQWRIGNDSGGAVNWDGLVEDFAIFDGRLTQAQARALYRGADPRAIGGRLREYVPLRQARPVSRLTGPLATITGTKPRRGRWQSVVKNVPRLPAWVTTTASITAATMAYTGQSITTNAKTNVSVTTGTMAYTGQPTFVKRLIAVIAGIMNYGGQSVTVTSGGGVVAQVWQRLKLGLGFGL